MCPVMVLICYMERKNGGITVTQLFCSMPVFQLQGRFEQLKRLHADEKAALEEKKRLLDDDQSSFSKRRAAAQLLQAQSLTANGKKDKDRKK